MTLLPTLNRRRPLTAGRGTVATVCTVPSELVGDVLRHGCPPEMLTRPTRRVVTRMGGVHPWLRHGSVPCFARHDVDVHRLPLHDDVSVSGTRCRERPESATRARFHEVIGEEPLRHAVNRYRVHVPTVQLTVVVHRAQIERTFLPFATGPHARARCHLLPTHPLSRSSRRF